AFSNNADQLPLNSTGAVLTMGSRPDASIAAVRSLRRLAQRLAETLAWIGTIRSRTERMAARSRGTRTGMLSVKEAKQLTAETRSRCRVAGKVGLAFRPLRTSWSVARSPVTTVMFLFIWLTLSVLGGLRWPCMDPR